MENNDTMFRLNNRPNLNNVSTIVLSNIEIVSLLFRFAEEF